VRCGGRDEPMGLFKKQVTRNLPKNAEILEKNGQRHARWTTRGGGKQTALLVGEPGAERIRTQSSTWYVRLALADGTRREVNTGCRDKGAAAAWLAAEMAQQERIRAGLVSAAELDLAKSSRKPLEEVIDAFAHSLADKGRVGQHVDKTRRYLERSREALGWEVLADLDGDALVGWLAEQAYGARTANGFIVAHKSFGTWATRRGWLARDPFEHVERRNERADRRHERRALTTDEVARLMHAARTRPLLEARRGNRGKGRSMGKDQASLSNETIERLRWLGETRAMAYRIAVQTGLRWGELRSITMGAVRLGDDPPHLLLAAADEKARRGGQIPLGDDLARELDKYVRERRKRLLGHPGASLVEFPAMVNRAPLLELPENGVKVFHADRELAGIPRADSAGRVVDIHALRHTYGTTLAKAGVPLQVVQKAMRHSTPVLTSNVYTHLTALDVKVALDKLPSYGIDAEKQIAEVSVARNVARNSGAGGQSGATTGNSTTEIPDSGTSHTIRTLTNNDGGCQRMAREGDGGPCRTRTYDQVIMSHLL